MKPRKCCAGHMNSMTESVMPVGSDLPVALVFHSSFFPNGFGNFGKFA